MPNEVAPASQEHILAPLCQQWLRKIDDAKKAKWDRFGQYAVEAMKFFDGPHDWMWKDEYSKGVQGFLAKDSNASLPTFRMQVNRLFEAVALFGPALYHRNPDITVTPISPPFIDPQALGMQPPDPNIPPEQMDPQMQQAVMQYQQIVQQQDQAVKMRTMKAQLSQHYLNWLQVEGDKKTNARRSITEAIIKGAGVLWTHILQPQGSQIKYPLSQHISIDDIVVDPDAEYWEDVQWIARYCCHPVNLVEREYGLRPGSLKGHMQSANAQGDIYGSRRETSKKRRSGRSFDLCEYWMVYSKNGFGDRLRKTDSSVSSKFNFEAFGDFCRIVVAENVPFPFNMPTEVLKIEDEQQLFMRSQWEVPYWTNGGWPMTWLTFYDKPRCVWPVSLVKPAIGELRFINWCMSFLADKTASSCTTYLAVSKQAGMEIQNQIQNGMAPYTVLEISQITGRSINDVVSFLEAPNFSVDIWKMLAEVMEQVDKRMGLIDLIYGMTDTQIRSATEADVKEQNTNIRPDDMASRVEDFLSETAVNEMAAMVWACQRPDYEHVLGPIGAQVFESMVQTDEFEVVMRDYDYRVAAGSARKPNKNSKQRALTELGQVILPTLQQYAAQGVVEPWNAYISEIAQTMDIDPSGFLLQPVQNDGPTPEEQMQQMEIQKMQLEMQLKQQEMQAKLQLQQQSAMIDQQAAQAEAELKQQDAMATMELEEDKAAMEMETEQAKTEMQLAQEQALFEQELQQQRELGAQELMIERAKLAMMTKEQEIKLEGMKAMNAAKVQAQKAQAAAAAKAKSKQPGGNKA